MKRVLLIILLHLSLFFLVFAYQAQASEEEWKIDRYESLVFARVYGQVILILKKTVKKFGTILHFIPMNSLEI